MTNLTGRIKCIYLNNFRSCLTADISQDILERSKAVVVDFFPVTLLHSLHAETFKTDNCILLT